MKTVLFTTLALLLLVHSPAQAFEWGDLIDWLDKFGSPPNSQGQVPSNCIMLPCATFNSGKCFGKYELAGKAHCGGLKERALNYQQKICCK